MSFSEMHNVVFLLGRVSQRGDIVMLGTCFLTTKPGVFVTCLHGVSGNDNNLVLIIQNNRDSKGYQDTAINQVQQTPLKIIEADPLTDLCLLQASSPSVSNLKLTGTDHVSPGEKVTVFGFPHANTGRNVLTQQTTEIGAKILMDNSGLKSKHLVLNIQARPGQSGGPVIRNSDLSLVGVLIGSYVPPSANGSLSLGGIDPQTLHQTTHAISGEYVSELINNV